MRFSGRFLQALVNDSSHSRRDDAACLPLMLQPGSQPIKAGFLVAEPVLKNTLAPFQILKQFTTATGISRPTSLHGLTKPPLSLIIQQNL